jgi:phosphoribosylformylglycinamidine synthase
MAKANRLPRLDLERERAVQETTLRAAEEGLLQSAHDCAEGGLAVALAEGCFSSLGRDRIGVEINLDGDLAPTAHLFAETPSRIVVSFDPSARARLEEIAAGQNCPLHVIGRTGGTRLLINHNGDELVSQDIHELETLWRASLGGNLRTEVLVAAAE